MILQLNAYMAKYNKLKFKVVDIFKDKQKYFEHKNTILHFKQEREKELSHHIRLNEELNEEIQEMQQLLIKRPSKIQDL